MMTRSGAFWPAVALALAMHALPAAAQSVNGQGGFAVFGNSADRAKFFEDQAAAAQERADEIRKERREAAARAAAAEAEAEAAPRRRGIASRSAPYCFRVADRDHDLRLRTRVIGGEVVTPRATSREKDGPAEIWCVPYRFGTYFRRPVNRTAIQIGIDGDGVSGRTVIRRPGLDVDLSFD